MKKYQGFLLASAGGLAAAAGGAQAADMPVKARIAAPPPAPTWTGCYVGGHLGAAWHIASAAYAESGDAPGGFGGQNWGVIGGGQLGCNWQTNNWVWGLEGDISGLSGKTKGGGVTTDPGKGNALESQLRWLATLRGRLGYAVTGGMMAYVTGGLAVGKVKAVFDPDGLLTNACCDGIKSGSKTKWGWTAGFGVEYMWTRNWTVGLETLWVDLGKFNGSNPGGDKTSTFRHRAAIMRVKMNYKF